MSGLTYIFQYDQEKRPKQNQKIEKENKSSLTWIQNQTQLDFRTAEPMKPTWVQSHLDIVI